MNFLEHIFERLARSADLPVLQEIRGEQIVSATGAEFLARILAARAFLRRSGFAPGDRCALLAHNSIQWAALDLALLAEGIIVVPLYARQAASELVAMLKDAQPRLVCCGTRGLADALAAERPGVPPCVLFDEIFSVATPAPDIPDVPLSRAPTDIVTIIYTSGTSGEAKGVCLTVSNLDHMLDCTTQRLDQLMGPAVVPDRIFHYLPFNFAGSWILLLSALSRPSVLALSTDLNKIADEIRLAAPNYFLNVPTLLERVRKGAEDNLSKRGGFALKIFHNASNAFLRRDRGEGTAAGAFWLSLANLLIFTRIRGRFGSNLKALICGSAPLARETQLFFHMLGVPVLQVYGLTETTGICTMDDPRAPVEPGYVGPAIPGIEMQLGENEEILVRGPHIFPGYWNRPEETVRGLRDGWFHTGDQGEVSPSGNWRIVGRIKNLIILNSGHNIAPEPIEEKLLAMLPGAQHAVLVGNGRGYLTALLTGDVSPSAVPPALDAANKDLPHYKQVRGFSLLREPFTIENGLLTANGKLRRDAVAARFAAEIEAMYHRKSA